MTKRVAVDGASTVTFAHRIFYGGTPCHKMSNFHIRFPPSLSCYESGRCVSLHFWWACQSGIKIVFPSLPPAYRADKVAGCDFWERPYEDTLVLAVDRVGTTVRKPQLEKDGGTERTLQ